MSESKPKESRIIKTVQKNVNLICFFSYIIGVLWFLALSLRDLGAPTYQDENALLPGLQDPHFGLSEAQEASEYNRLLSQYMENEDLSELHDKLIQMMQESGINAYKQTFSSKSTVPDRIDGKLTYKIENGTNVYGLIRAGRASSTESIVLNIPISKTKFNHAIGIALAFGRQIREQNYWAKDIILLFTEMGYVGAQAWLQSYTDNKNSDFIKSSPLEERAGMILGALILDIPEVSSHLNADVVGNNGQLPNMDLFVVLIKLCNREGIRVSVHDELTSTYNAMTVDGYMKNLRATVSMMSKQAKGFSSGNHAMFLQRNIQSLSIQGVNGPSSRTLRIVNIGRAIEGVARSLNNLLEKLHHSFFFYLLSSTDRFISIGLYMPPLGLVVLAPTLKALCLWIAVRKSEKTEDETTEESNDETIDEILKEMKSIPFENKQATPVTPWIEMSYILALAYILGVGLYLSPRFAATWSAMFEISTRSSLLLIFLSTYLVGLSLPFTSLISFSKDSKVLELLRITSLVIHAGTLGCVAVLNFSLGLFLAVITVPLVTPVRANCGKFQPLCMLLTLLASPLAILAILVCSFQLFSGKEMEIFSSFENILRNLYEQSLLGNNWIFPFTCLLLYPNWLVFWVQSAARM